MKHFTFWKRNDLIFAGQEEPSILILAYIENTALDRLPWYLGEISQKGRLVR